jgi:hypothetical protein
MEKNLAHFLKILLFALVFTVLLSLKERKLVSAKEEAIITTYG